ncbi:MAG: Xaa-Pro peptidase family protein [Coprothermobacterota bacterium]|nr:Xaa-Pro peptidase family protein [Coprothermobacterota bacterium]
MTDMNLYAERLGRLQEGLGREGVQAQLVASPANLAYLLGQRPMVLERLLLLVVPAQGEPRLIIPQMHTGEFAHLQGLLAMDPWKDGEDPLLLATKVITEMVGVLPVQCDRGVPAVLALALRNHFPSLTLRVAEGSIAKARIRKEAAEVNRLLAAGEAADRAMAEAVRMLRPGMSELEIAGAIIASLLREGAEPDPSLPIVASGPNGAFPHHNTCSRSLESGDAIVLDFGGRCQGYFSDMTRTAFLGDPPKEFLRVYRTVAEAKEKATSAIRPGVRIGELDRIARAHIEAAGYGPFFTHRLGHGLGLEVHEEPYVHAGNDLQLEEGMCFSVEPGVYLPGRFGVRLEDCVVVESDGPRSLTAYPLDLICR